MKSKFLFFVLFLFSGYVNAQNAEKYSLEFHYGPAFTTAAEVFHAPSLQPEAIAPTLWPWRLALVHHGIDKKRKLDLDFEVQNVSFQTGFRLKDGTKVVLNKEDNPNRFGFTQVGVGLRYVPLNNKQVRPYLRGGIGLAVARAENTQLQTNSTIYERTYAAGDSLWIEVYEYWDGRQVTLGGSAALGVRLFCQKRVQLSAEAGGQFYLADSQKMYTSVAGWFDTRQSNYQGAVIYRNYDFWYVRFGLNITLARWAD